MSPERRRHPRVRVDVAVQITAEDRAISGHLHDLSVDATLLEAPQAWPVGTAVRLAFELPDGGGSLDLAGTVIRVAEGEGQGQAMAVLFADLPPAAATRIDLFMGRRGGLG